MSKVVPPTALPLVPVERRAPFSSEFVSQLHVGRYDDHPDIDDIHEAVSHEVPMVAVLDAVDSARRFWHRLFSERLAFSPTPSSDRM